MAVTAFGWMNHSPFVGARQYHFSTMLIASVQARLDAHRDIMEVTVERIPAFPVWIILPSIACVGLLIATLGLGVLLASRYKLAGIGIAAIGLLLGACMLAVFFFAPVWN